MTIAVRGRVAVLLFDSRLDMGCPFSVSCYDLAETGFRRRPLGQFQTIDSLGFSDFVKFIKELGGVRFDGRANALKVFELGHSVEPTLKTCSVAGLLFCLRAQFGHANPHPGRYELGSNETSVQSPRGKLHWGLG